MPEEKLDNPLVIVGDQDIVSGFKALGFKTYGLRQESDISAIWQEVIDEKAAICLVQENIYSLVKDRIDSYRNLPIPIFIPFSKSGKMDLLNNIVKDIKIRATGAF